MQRPRSDGRRSGSHSQNQPPLVTRSLQFGERRGRNHDNDVNQPRRPNTTPKPHIQRLLSAPGQSTAQDWSISSQMTSLPPSTLIRLPDSPPHSPPVRSVELINSSKVTNTVHGVIEAGKSASDPDTDIVDNPSLNAGAFDKANPSLSYDNEQDSGDARFEYNLLEPGQHSEEREDDTDALNAEGPLLTDIHSGIDGATGANQEGHQDLKTGLDRVDDDDDNDYKQALSKRKQLLLDEENRQHIREELETYVGSLSSRTDENGEHLVEFPRNYQQVVSLMTQKDVIAEDTQTQEGQTTRQSWSRVLIESGLSKQQAFGILEDVDGDPEGSNMAAKIALKMARIRQLDTVLEEKLGKNLYANIVPRKQKKAQNATSGHSSRPGSSSSASRTFVTQTQSNSGGTNSSSKQISQTDNEIAPGAKKSTYFIERNKQVVANGMKANMTKDEEDRLEKLLSDEVDSTGDGTPSDHAGDVCAKPEDSQECNEFTMTDADKEAIEELIATKSGAYPLFNIDEAQDRPTDEALIESGRPGKDNIIQETKRERMQRRRLSRVEQELRFLHESPSVIIVGDEHDGDENDDTRSEISFATVASSTCSTRSGVISRHDFKCFLARQKETFRSTPTASADEIRRLLLSINPETAASSNVVTAPTG